MCRNCVKGDALSRAVSVPRPHPPKALLAMLAGLVLALSFSSAPLAAEVKYNADKDYSVSSNPGAPWSYGYRLGSSPFTLYTEAFKPPIGLDIWRIPGIDGANVAHNGTAETKSEAGRIWKPGQVSLHPGPSGEVSIIRFTAPTAGDFNVEAAFSVGQIPDGGPATTTNVSIVAGKQVLLNDGIDGNADVKDVAKLARLVTLAKGGTIEFQVAGGADWTYDTTFVRIIITPVQPATVDISLTAIPEGPGYRLESKLTSQRLSCIQGVEVTFRESGALIKRAETNSKGVAQVFAPGRDKATTYTAVAPGGPGCKASAVIDVATNPRPTGDSDGDGIVDYIELEPSYIKAGGRVDHKDVWVECDYMTGLRPRAAAFKPIVLAFKNAPLKNPDGVDGASLHVKIADAIKFEDQWGDVETGSGFKATRAKLLSARTAHFGKAKYASHAEFAHYCAFVNAIDNTSISGISMDSKDPDGGIPGDMFIVSLGRWTPKGGTLLDQGGTLMHELGHNLGLRHGGDDHANYEPNYFSVMNYNYQSGFWTDEGGKPRQVAAFDYSRFEAVPLSEKTLSEEAGLKGKTAADQSVINDLAARYVGIHDCPVVDGKSESFVFALKGRVDWDCDDKAADKPVAVDINGDGKLTELKGQNNWKNLVWDGGAIGSGAEAPSAAPGHELDFETYLEFRRTLQQ